MDVLLNEVEIRVLGALIEKEITTPEYYPLTLNSLVTACNQKTNREPVTSYTDCTVSETLDALIDKGLVIVSGLAGRVPKYDNYFAETYSLSKPEVALMCVLMLRGPQTAGELRGRTERMHNFEDVPEVEEILMKLAGAEGNPLVVRLPRQPGRKEARFAHQLSGKIELAEIVPNNERGLCSEIDRILQLEEEINNLKREFQEFKRQFE